MLEKQLVDYLCDLRDNKINCYGILNNASFACDYSSNDLQDLINTQLNSEDTKNLNIGIFITDLAKKLVKTGFEVVNLDIPLPLKNVGYNWNKGKLVIKGNLGSYVCSNMSGGLVVVNGDVGDYACDQMSGGVFILHGNANYAAASRVKGNGCIIIDGDAGLYTGFYRTGTIIIAKKLDKSCLPCRWTIAPQAMYDEDSILELIKYQPNSIPLIDETRFLLKEPAIEKHADEIFLLK